MHFNPRSREGSDRATAGSNNSSSISIHAPARGATWMALSTGHGSSNFNPRSREGSDHAISAISQTIPYFNPRSREGSDKSWKTGQRGLNRISIHAPARGATEKRPHRFDRLRISIHAPARGATLPLKMLRHSFRFQSTLPRGERPDELLIMDFIEQFQSTLPRGERHCCNSLFA